MILSDAVVSSNVKPVKPFILSITACSSEELSSMIALIQDLRSTPKFAPSRTSCNHWTQHVLSKRIFCSPLTSSICPLLRALSELVCMAGLWLLGSSYPRTHPEVNSTLWFQCWKSSTARMLMEGNETRLFDVCKWTSVPWTSYRNPCECKLGNVYTFHWLLHEKNHKWRQYLYH